jgi:VWFA-related protein
VKPHVLQLGEGCNSRESRVQRRDEPHISLGSFLSAVFALTMQRDSPHNQRTTLIGMNLESSLQGFFRPRFRRTRGSKSEEFGFRGQQHVPLEATNVGMTPVMPRYLCPLKWCQGLPKFPSMASLSYRQGWSLIVVLVICPSLLFAATPSDQPQITYRTGAAEVRVPFFATDQNGHPLDTITQDDFAIVDSGVVIRDFRSLARSNETALDIVALIDTSESVAPRFRANMQHVLKLGDSESGTSNDGLSIIEFSALQPTIVCSGNCRSADAEQKLHSVIAKGATPLFDALTYTAQFVSQRRVSGARQVVLLFSDGNDTISRASPREAFQALLATGAVLYAVNVDPSGAVSSGSVLLQQLAEATGGRSFSVHEDTRHVLQAIMAELRSAYVVTYSLPNHQTGFHSLRILPKHNLNLRFHCRRGYSYEDTP